MQTARLNQRTPFLGRVDIVPHVGATRLAAWGQDVSETGMFLQTTEQFAVGDSLSVRFEVDGLEVHVRSASVVWVRRFEPVNVDGKSPGIGIRFISIDPPARAALRRLTSQKAANDTMVRTDVMGGVADNMLPQPTLTLPPLSRSIIAAAGGRDLDDTQDLLPPSSLPRHTGEAISLPPLQFTAVPQPAIAVTQPMIGLPTTPPTIPTLMTGRGHPARPEEARAATKPAVAVAASTMSPALKAPLPPEMSSSDDDVNLTSESRVFAGVAAAPRAISMPPRVRTKPPTQLPTLSLATSTAPIAAVGAPINVTQPLHSLPPVIAEEAVDVFAGWTFKKVEPAVVAVANIDAAFEAAPTLPPTAVDESAGRLTIDADIAAVLQQHMQEEDDDALDDSVDDSALDAFADLAAGRPSGVPTIINPSIIEATTLPPTTLPPTTLPPTTLPPTTATTTRDDVSLSGAVDAAFFADALSQAEDPALAKLDESGAYSLGPTLVVETLPLSRAEPTMNVRTPSAEPGRARRQPQQRRSLQVAAVVLAAGCAAGAAVGVLSRASQRPVTPTTTVAAAAVVDAAPVVLPVAEAEAELFGKAAKTASKAMPAPPPAVAPVVGKVDAPVAPIEVAVVEKVIEKGPEKAVEKAVEKAPAKVEDTTHVAVKAPTKKAPLVARPGRLEVDLPTGGRVKKVFALAGPSRLVVDLEDAKLPGAPVDVDEAGTLQLRFGKPDAGTQRVVVVLAGDNKPDAVEAVLQGDRLVATWQR